MVMLRLLKKLDARTEAILINTTPDEDLTSTRIPSVEVTYAGFVGESHSGLVRASCVRVREQYKEGTEIRNTRQISIVSVEELSLIADAMGIDNLEPEWVGANLLVSGIPEFSKIPPSTRMIFASGHHWWWIWKTAPASTRVKSLNAINQARGSCSRGLPMVVGASPPE